MSSTSVSIVLYRTPAEEVRCIVASLRQCEGVGDIWLIDNSEIQTEAFMFLPATYIFNNRNLGYGAAHNIALQKSIDKGYRYHLVVNSDIEVTSHTISTLINYLDQHNDVAHVMPKVLYPDGSQQHLAKLLPTPYDLLVRRFLPKALNQKRTAYFELHTLPDNCPTNVPYLSGCFMLLRCQAIKEIGFFDTRYFMYPEDIDLTRRLHSRYRTIYYPLVNITHHHRQASYHSLQMLWIHIVNICRYFNKWGWIFDTERKKINKATLLQITK